MKLNYTSLQHPVDPVEARSGWRDPAERDNGGDSECGGARAAAFPVLVLSLHGQLAPAAWAARRAGPELRVGYVQTTGRSAAGLALRGRRRSSRLPELLCGHVTAGAAFGGELEAVSVIGALQAAAGPLGWDAVIAGPGPGISGSGSALGHGGLVALDTRARLADPGPRDAARAADVERGPAPAPPRPQPSHRDRAPAAARQRPGPRPRRRSPRPGRASAAATRRWPRSARACGDRHRRLGSRGAGQRVRGQRPVRDPHGPAARRRPPLLRLGARRRRWTGGPPPLVERVQ